MEGANGFRRGLEQTVFDGLQVALDVRRGRAQFMGDVGGEVAAVTLRFFQLDGHGIETVRQLAHFRWTRGCGALRQVAPSQSSGGGAQPLQRGQSAPRQRPHQRRPQNRGADAGPKQVAVHQV